MPKGITPADALAVYVSYSRRDSAVAGTLASALESRGIRTFIDRRHLPHGEKWHGEPADSISASDTVIRLVSAHSISSKWCNWELDEAQRQHRRGRHRIS